MRRSSGRAFCTIGLAVSSLPVGEKDLEGHQGMSQGDQLVDCCWNSYDVMVNGRNEGSRNGGKGRGETGEL